MPHTRKRSTTYRLLKFQVSFNPFSPGPLFSQCTCHDREIFQPQTVMEWNFFYDFLQFTSQTSVFPQGECSFGDTGETYLKSFQSIWCSDRWSLLEWGDSVSSWEVLDNTNLLQFPPSLRCKVPLEKTLSSRKVFWYILVNQCVPILPFE